MKQHTFSKVLTWLDEHALFILSCFLFAFIPLYPKLPLFDIIPGYLVRVRVEDFLVLLTVGFLGVQILRGKQPWKTPFTFAVGLYAVAGILSIISGVVITRTIPAELLHIGKSALHYFRYLEYFSLLFVVAAGLTSKTRFKILLAIITVTVLVISFYGYGQRYWYWPVYSTMNREFSKGLRLYLDEHARVQSTFGGHYDLAAYLVIVLPLLLSAYYLIRSKLLKLGIAVVFLAGLWTLMQTASRSSFGGYFIAIALCVFLYAGLQTGWLQKIRTLFISGILVLWVSLYMLFTFGGDMYDRLLQTLAGYPEIDTQYHYWNGKRKDTIQQSTEYVVGLFVGSENKEAKTDELKNKLADLSGAEATPPPNSMSLQDLEVMVASDTTPTPVRPADVYVDVPVTEEVSTVSADGTVTTEVITKDREFSANAFAHGLSMAIRLDTLWPRALQGFYRNPVFGSGYATLTKESVGIFTEAESTDNNFLRTLGETGAFGFITFYGIVVIGMFQAWVLYRKVDDRITQIFVIGYLSGAVGLLVNAALIDVYAASKVAFTYWSLTGVIVALGVYHHRCVIIPQPSWLRPQIGTPKSKEVHVPNKTSTTRTKKKRTA